MALAQGGGKRAFVTLPRDATPEYEEAMVQYAEKELGLRLSKSLSLKRTRPSLLCFYRDSAPSVA